MTFTNGFCCVETINKLNVPASFRCKKNNYKPKNKPRYITWNGGQSKSMQSVYHLTWWKLLSIFPKCIIVLKCSLKYGHVRKATFNFLLLFLFGYESNLCIAQEHCFSHFGDAHFTEIQSDLILNCLNQLILSFHKQH